MKEINVIIYIFIKINQYKHLLNEPLYIETHSTEYIRYIHIPMESLKSFWITLLYSSFDLISIYMKDISVIINIYL